MAAFMIFYQDAIHDRDQLMNYQKQAGPTLANRPVTPRVVTESVETIEGDWSPVRVVVLEFPTREDAMAWYNSPEYTEVRKMRLGATKGAGIIVDTLPSR